MPERYRSYVVRIRGRDDSPDGLRADVEDIIGGGRSALSGEAARALADGLAATVGDAPDRARPSPDEPPEAPGA